VGKIAGLNMHRFALWNHSLALARWTQLAQGLGLKQPLGGFQEVVSAWGEPQRAYHTLEHLSECLELFEAIGHHAQQPAQVAFALWMHDAVYDPTRSDNEALSAAWADRLLVRAGAANETRARIEALIAVTRHEATPATPDEALLVDIDLAILGADSERFERYEAQVRREYAFVPEASFRVARRAIMQAFAQRNPLYLTEVMRAAREDQARRNLAWSILHNTDPLES
jgi:predicted metal-dependent HD superfamily phosphohydrolase